MAFITRHCRIQHYTLIKQGRVIYQNSAAGIDVFLDGAMKSLLIAYPKFYKMDRLSKLGVLGAEMLWANPNPVERYGPQAVALALSNRHASLDTDVRYFETTRTIPSPALFVYTLTNIVMGEICIRYGIKGENAFFVLPQFDAELLAGYVRSVMQPERTNACIAGWVDVMGDQHDVFLYLVEKQTDDEGALAHTPEQLKKLYQAEYGTVDGRSQKTDHRGVEPEAS